MRPAMLMALAGCLALTAYVALQPEPLDDLAAPRERRPVEQPRPGAAPPPGSVPMTAIAKPDERQALSAALRQWHASQHQAALPEPEPGWAQAWASQQPPPPPPVYAEVAEPAAPVAPTFPHAWVGRYLDPLPKAIIAGPTGTWVIAAGDVLEGQWRIDAIQERRMTLTYLPLDQSQTVALK